MKHGVFLFFFLSCTAWYYKSVRPIVREFLVPHGTSHEQAHSTSCCVRWQALINHQRVRERQRERENIKRYSKDNEIQSKEKVRSIELCKVNLKPAIKRKTEWLPRGCTHVQLSLSLSLRQTTRRSDASQIHSRRIWLSRWCVCVSVSVCPHV